MQVQGIFPRLSRGFVRPWKLGKLRNNLKGNKSFCRERNSLPNLKAAEAVYTKADKRHVAYCFRLFTPRSLDICSPRVDINKLSFNIENSFLTNHKSSVSHKWQKRVGNELSLTGKNFLYICLLSAVSAVGKKNSVRNLIPTFQFPPVSQPYSNSKAFASIIEMFVFMYIPLLYLGFSDQCEI